MTNVRRLSWVATSVGAVLAAGWVAAADAPRTELERVRYIGTAAYSRIVVDLSGPARYRMQPVLPDGRSSGPPDRLVIDVAGATVGPEALEPLTIGDSLLRGIRTGQYTLETARIVLDLATDADARAFILPDPYRLIVDLKRKNGAAVAGDSKIQRLDSTSAGTPARDRASLPQARRERPSIPDAVEPSAAAASAIAGVAPGLKPRASTERESPVTETGARRLKVVIDPGHGGKDPGATGMDGLEEKELTLSVAKRLAALLRAEPGIDVALTRSDDRYLTLEERTGFANAQSADLFVSVHGNASVNPGLRGVEVYYLNNTDNRGTLRLAAMENNLRWDPHNPKLQSAIPDLSYILSDLRQTYKVEESKQLAEQLQSSVVTQLGARYDGVDDLGVKEGPFYVLVGAYMPCVLVEVSFLTNPVEGKRLGTSSYRDALADGIHQGIRRYLSQTRLAKTL
jgi:N-acetylmuramoyl-L-alanine amidase